MAANLTLNVHGEEDNSLVSRTEAVRVREDDSFSPPSRVPFHVYFLIGVALLGVVIAFIIAVAAAASGSNKTYISEDAKWMISNSATPPSSDWSTGVLVRETMDGWYSADWLCAPVGDFAMLRVGNLIFITGGSTKAGISNKTMKFDTDTHTCTFVADMPSPRYRHAATSIDNKFYIFGGLTTGDVLISQVYEYDVATDTWTLFSNMPDSRSDLAAEAVNGKAYVFGGWDVNYNTALFGRNLVMDPSQPEASRWKYTTSDIPFRRGDLNSAVINNKIYAVGGWDCNTGRCEPFAGAEEYDPSTDKWTVLPDMPTGRGDPAVASFNNNQLFVIGGEQYASDGVHTESPIHNVEMFDLTTQKWTAKRNIEFSRFRFEAIEANGKMWVIGGFDETDRRVKAVDYYIPDSAPLYVHTRK